MPRLNIYTSTYIVYTTTLYTQQMLILRMFKDFVVDVVQILWRIVLSIAYPISSVTPVPSFWERPWRKCQYIRICI